MATLRWNRPHLSLLEREWLDERAEAWRHQKWDVMHAMQIRRGTRMQARQRRHERETSVWVDLGGEA